MPGRCAVPGCNNESGGHRFPAGKERLKWTVAIRRAALSKSGKSSGKLWEPGKYDVVCSRHFRSEDYTQTTLLGERRRLLKGRVPTLGLPGEETLLTSDRTKRAILRSVAEIPEVAHEVPEVAQEVTIDGEFEGSVALQHSDTPQLIDTASQCSLLNTRQSIYNHIDRPDKILYYTSFSTYMHFMYFFTLLGPAVSRLKNLKFCPLPPEDQLFLTLMKLRMGKENKELSYDFQISKKTVALIFNTWINFIYLQLRELSIWPDKSTIQQYCPSSFKNAFPKTRVILDATEVPIQKPSNVNAQSHTWSSYKNKNTLKIIVGVTPRGQVSFLSNTYGGSVSDRQIVESSTLVKDSTLLEKGDSLMADRGLLIQDIFATRDIEVNTPTMLKGKSQLAPHDVKKDRCVASKRIHVERVIGLAKTYKILKSDLKHCHVGLGGRIISVCFLLTNFRESIVGKDA